MANLTPRTKSKVPSCSPKSQCSFGSKENDGFSPIVSKTTLSSSLSPFGTQSSGILGIAKAIEINSSSNTLTSSSRACFELLQVAISACKGAISKPSFLYRPNSRESWFCFAVISSMLIRLAFAS